MYTHTPRVPSSMSASTRNLYDPFLSQFLAYIMACYFQSGFLPHQVKEGAAATTESARSFLPVCVALQSPAEGHMAKAVSSAGRHKRNSTAGLLGLGPLVTERKSLTRRLLEAEEERKEGNSRGKFGSYGGNFVPETLIASLRALEDEFNLVLHDAEFQEELAIALKDYVGRETPLYFAQRLTDHYKDSNGEGPEIYLKREDLSHGGAHKINNAMAQAILAKRMGRKSVVAATGAGQHGVATAAACAKLSLECTIFMGNLDMERQSSNVLLMKMFGAKVKSIDGNFKDATSEAIRNWVGNLETSYYLGGTAVGPHPLPSMVCEFQSVIGKETKKQAMEKWGGKPEVLVACVGSGSNALGLFHEFVRDEDVRLIGIEAAGSATLAKGEVGVYHGAMTYLLQDEEGQIIGPHSVAVGMEYPGVSPELSFLKDIGRAEFYTVTDQEAVDACQRLCRLEGIMPALEASHALAFLDKLCPALPHGTKVVVNCSGRGDKDTATLFKYNWIHQLMEDALEHPNV